MSFESFPKKRDFDIKENIEIKQNALFNQKKLRKLNLLLYSGLTHPQTFLDLIILL